MSTEFCAASNLSFSHPGQITTLFSDLSFTLPRGWCGIVGANGSGKTTLARLLLGELAPASGSVNAPASRHHCRQEVAEVPEALLDLLSVAEADAHRMIESLAVGYDWPYRWETLSHGERKRAQLAAALYLQPDLLVLDEPTNHLDIDAVRMIRTALSTYHGIGILISHDRALLDQLCERCLFIDSGSVTLRPGGFTQGLAEADRERESILRDRQNARRELTRLKREANRRKTEAAASESRVSKRNLAPHDSDGRGRINLARVSGKDAVAGKLLKQMDQRIERASQRIDASRVSREAKLGVTIGAQAARRDLLFRLEAGEIAMGERTITIPELTMAPTDRVALMGPNGAGKSTLVRAIVSRLMTDRYLFLPQELPEQTIFGLTAKLAALDPAPKGALISAVTRLGSDPERVLETARPSPGEARKLMIAFGLTEGVELIVLDEPTNHMDLPSIRCIEEALASCGAALLLVTHDEEFARRLATVTWRISETGGDGESGSYILKLQ